MKEFERHVVDIIKKKSSSGCLIIKKKVGVNDSGFGSNDSSSRVLYSSRIDKKRSRAGRSESKSSDHDEVREDTQFRRKLGKFGNGTSGYSNVGFTENNGNGGFMGNRESSDHEFTEAPFRRKVELFDNSTSGYGNVGLTVDREFRAQERVNSGSRGFMGNREFRNEKRTINEFDGYREKMVNSQVDEYDNNGYPERIRINTHGPLNDYMQSGDRRESGSGSGSGIRICDKRRDFVNDRGSGLGGKSSRFDHKGIKRGYEMDHGESRLPGLGFQVSDQPIRLQGKNGVLKVMVKKHKPINVPYQTYVPPVEVEERREARPEAYLKKEVNVSRKSFEHWDAASKKTVVGSSLYSSLIHPEILIASKSKEKREIKMVNNDMVTPLPLKLSRVQHSSAEKRVKVEKKISPPTENVTPVVKESKVKRGTGTEKQLLREKIRSMLLGAGWTIDYRPRRNRDYQDAVYINPAGTAYWSIIKAYEALQKEEKDCLQAVGDFTPLPVETLSKLTRQTKKKIEREMKKKRRDEGVNRNAKRDRTEVSAETSKRRLEEASEDSGDDSNDSYYMKLANQERAAMGTGEGLNSRKLGRRTLLVRCEGKFSESDGLVTYPGKRTLLSWLIESGTVQLGEKVQYMNSKKRHVKKGWITKEGINCCCCSEILSVLKFELHAGSKLRQPYSNIFVQSGKSLTECQIDAWNKQGELERKGFHAVYAVGDDPNDDTCGLCGDGGDLICCDGCPSTFHQSCLGIQMLPQGDWHCPNCSCKYCELATKASVGAESPLLKCNLCEKKYHKSCSLEMDDKPIDHTDANLSFCGHKCLELYTQLQKLLGVKHELDSGFSWSLIHRSELSSDTSSIELSQRVECNSKLAVALSVIDECFLPFIERRSGINLIHNVVYNCGSNSSRLNYSGFFTAILERDDEMICAASIRIHGTQLAEMPFFGTRHMYRRQGMCRRLLSSIESALSSLHVEKLIIPIAEHMRTWTDVFGFNPLEESHKQEMRSMNMLVFPGTDMLQKPLVHQVTPLDKAGTELEGSKPKSQKSDLTSPNVKELSDSGSEDPSVTLDDDASDATPSISSVKNDNPLPVLARKPEVLCDSAIQCDGDDTIMQNSEESTENIAHTDPIKAHSDATLSITSVKNDNSLPVLARKSEVLCDSTVQCDGDDTIIKNSEESTENIVHTDPIEARSAHSDSIVAKDNVQDGNETTKKIASGNSKVDGFALQNGKVTSPTKTIDVDSAPPQDPHYVLRDSETSDSPLLLNEPDSLNASSGSNVEELADKIVDLPSDNPCDISGKDSISVSANSDINIDVQNSEIADAMLPDIHDQNDTVSPEPPLIALEALPLDPCVAAGVQNRKTADSPTDNSCEITRNELVSISADSDFNTDVQNDKIADAIPHETQVPNDTISTALQSSGLESLPLDPHVAAEVQNGKMADLPSDNPCEITGKGSSTDSDIKLEIHVQNDSISTELQCSGLESVMLGPNLASEVQNEKIADLPSDNPCEAPGKSLVSVSANSDTNIDVQNSKIADVIPLDTHDGKDAISSGPQLVGQESPHLAADVQYSTVEEASNMEKEK